MPDLSFREKTILGSLVATLLVAVGYFAKAVPMLQSGASLADFVAPAVSAIVLAVVVQIVYQILLSIGSRPGPRDERDRLVDLRAARIAYVALACGVGVVIAALATAPLLGAWGSPLVMLHALMLVSMIAELVKFGAQLVYYRRSA
jgi:hypothetical protein